MLSDVLEALGVVCFAVALAFLLSWPYALFPAGLYLIVAAYGIGHSEEDE